MIPATKIRDAGTMNAAMKRLLNDQLENLSKRGIFQTLFFPIIADLIPLLSIVGGEVAKALSQT